MLQLSTGVVTSCWLVSPEDNTFNLDCFCWFYWWPRDSGDGHMTQDSFIGHFQFTSWKLSLLFDSRRGLGILLFDTVFRPALGPTQPPIQRVPGALSLGAKRPVRLTTHLHLVSRSSEWSYTSTPQYVSMVWCLVKHRKNFTFTSWGQPNARQTVIKQRPVRSNTRLRGDDGV
jgi:hypothetical protein